LDSRFNTFVESAEWNDITSVWNIKTEGGDTYSSRYFILCTGFAAKRYIPALKSLETFKGISSHTASWPQDGIDIKDKRVGVIGTGSSGVQIIQEIAPDVSRLIVFQRTPNLALPMQQKKLDSALQNRDKETYQDIFQLRKQTFGGFLYKDNGRETVCETSAKRKEVYDQLFENGGFEFLASGYKDFLVNPQANDYGYSYWRDRTRARIRDPSVAENLAPTKAPHSVDVFSRI
jgi:cation diffusion facilitator CzcD-associated flavoprotein CzcO